MAGTHRDMLDLFTENPDDPALMVRQIQMLRAMVMGLAQEMTALRQILANQELMDDAAFRSRLSTLMAGDHSGAGAAPWRSYSWYPLFSGDEARLRALGASEEEIARFLEECAFLENLS